MNKYKYTSLVIAVAALLTSTSSCKKSLDINSSPNNYTDVPIAPLYTAAAVNVGFTGGSDLSRYTALIMQQWSGQSTGALNQTQQYEEYLIQGSDLNNLWSSFYTNTLVNLNIIISKAAETGSPHYSGVAKLLQAYTFGIMVDVWGKIPYTKALQLTVNTAPTYDDGSAIYPALLTLIDGGISDVSAATSVAEIPTTSPIYPGNFNTVSKAQWIKFGNTLKLRLLLHMMKSDPTAAGKISALIAASGTTFMASNADDFNGNFVSSTGGQNPIYQFETGSRNGYIVANNFIVNLMGDKQDPRMAAYFTPAGTPVPGNSPAPVAPVNAVVVGGVTYIGSVAGANPNEKYSHVGAQSTTNTTSYYLTGVKGEAPTHMLNYSEYLFIRAELALGGIGGTVTDANTFYRSGINNAMLDAGVPAASITTYLGQVNATLAGTPAHMLQQIIEEKYVANYGVVVEPWSDWRRTGYPLIAQPTTPTFVYNSVPRSFFYPQSEINLNPNAPAQKADLSTHVFWDN